MTRSKHCITVASFVQIDHKGQRVLAEVTRYDGRGARHEVEWRSHAGSNAGKCKAWVDFCRDLVYKEFTGTMEGASDSGRHGAM